MLHPDLKAVIDRLSLSPEAVDPRGREVVKIDPALIDAPTNGRVVLVTAMTPTPAGEGKTTTSIGLVDALSKMGKNVSGALREPSLGPLFGMKGGAIGGGASKVVPSDHINLHFTGDIHAVTTAHNLLSALVDNHMYFGKEPTLSPDNITWGRVLDMNDRALRKCEVGHATKKGPIRKERFDITAASEVMAVLCMSRDLADLQERLGRIVVGTDSDGKPLTARDFDAAGAMTAVLLDAMRPNLVRTMEKNPVFVHGGPFANIAQGTSTIAQTNLARKLSDIVITEAGFAFDLGGYKFCDLKCRNAGFRPAAVVLVVTVRALRYHGGADHEAGPNVEAVKEGLANIGAHLASMERLGLPTPLVAINRRPDDAKDEIDAVVAYCKERGARAVEGDHFARGGEGALALGEALVELLEAEPKDSPNWKTPYADDDAVPTKIEKVAQTVLGASGIELTEGAKTDLARIEQMGLEKLPICLAKTHLSISDDKTRLKDPSGFTMKVTGIRPAAGAGFLPVLCGPILTMPGLPKIPAAKGVGVENGAVVGLR